MSWNAQIEFVGTSDVMVGAGRTAHANAERNWRGGTRDPFRKTMLRRRRQRERQRLRQTHRPIASIAEGGGILD